MVFNVCVPQKYSQSNCSRQTENSDMEGLIDLQDVRIPPAAAMHLAIKEYLAAAKLPTLDRLLRGTGFTLDTLQKRLMNASLDGARPERVISAAQIINMYRYDTAEVLFYLSADLCKIPLRNFGPAYHELQRAYIEAMAMIPEAPDIHASGDSNSRMKTLMEEEDGVKDDQEDEEEGEEDVEIEDWAEAEEEFEIEEALEEQVD
ncbi:uncharacterized protein LOC144874425 isoform X2 [Branchiostoma floridae x Branchiostoma japonicum]